MNKEQKLRKEEEEKKRCLHFVIVVFEPICLLILKILTRRKI